MSRSQIVAEHLPLLRRYARALTGTQASGDAYVGAMLEALLQDPSLLDERYGLCRLCPGRNTQSARRHATVLRLAVRSDGFAFALA